MYLSLNNFIDLCLDQIPRTFHVFTRLFTSNTPWYFLDFAFEAVTMYKHVNIFGKGYSPGPIISCPASDHDPICPDKANLVQDHGYFFTVKFLLNIFAIFYIKGQDLP